MLTLDRSGPTYARLLATWRAFEARRGERVDFDTFFDELGGRSHARSSS